MPRTIELTYWITERENMRKRREGLGAIPIGKYGWSDDHLMGSYRYCNVRREDDKVTVWLARWWRPQFNDVWQILLARLINNIPTLTNLLPHVEAGDLESIRKTLKELRPYGAIFSSAYIVSTNGVSMDKVDYVIDKVIYPAKERQLFCWNNMRGTVLLHNAGKELCGLNGVASFMAGQIIADLKNTLGHPLQDALDWHTWATPGPGSLRGLEAYSGANVTPGTFRAALQNCWLEVIPHLPHELQNLHMQDFQNCMCEFSKYVRIKGGGHARNKYRAR